MQKRVFIIHGWDGHPDEGWLPWLKEKLQKQGFFVKIPLMPNSEEPKIVDWISHLRKIVAKVDEQTYFVGHSIGCQTILRYLESLNENDKIGGAVFVAGWLTLNNLETEEEKIIAKPWLETPINFEKIKLHTNKFSAIFSDNDPFIPMENIETFKEKLGAKTIIENKKGHFSGSDLINDLPIALEAVLEIAGEKP